MIAALHETCEQYVTRRLSEGWSIVWQRGYHLILSSPDGNILRPVDLRNDVETLRPNDAGDVNTLDSGTYADVDEVIPDEDTTRLEEYEGSPASRALFELPAHSGSGTINFVKGYVRSRGDADPAKTAVLIKTEATEYDGGIEDTTTDYEYYSHQWNTNPNTEVAWTWAQIDALQVGAILYSTYSFGQGFCTQVYVEVDYTLPAPGLENKSANMGARLMAAGVL